MRRVVERERQWRSAARSPATMGAGLSEAKGRLPPPAPVKFLSQRLGYFLWQGFE